MSNANSHPGRKTRPSKGKGTSPTRNAIGLAVLVLVVIVGCIQYSAYLGFRSTVRALEERTKDVDQGLMTVEQAEKLLGRSADGPDTTLKEGDRTIIKKTYTWRGAIKSYTLTAYFVKESDIRLLRYDAEGGKSEVGGD